jgi:RNA polymerase sigma-70 factor (ECF subfamily)
MIPASERALASPDEFRTIFDREFTYVWSTLHRLGVAQSDLKDQVQEVFLTVHRILAEYDRARPIRPWLFGIALRIVARYRSKRPAYDLVETDEPASSAPLPDETVQAHQERALVTRALSAIAWSRRPVFVMAEIDEVPVTEIASVLDIPLNTAYSRLRLAREEFAAAIERLHGCDEGRAR